MIKSFFTKIIDFFITLLLIIWGTFVFGLGLYLGILFAYYGVFWVLGVMCFFLIFHIGDLIEFFKGRKFIALIGRLVCLYALTSFICGFIAYAGGVYQIKSNYFNEFALIFALGISLIGCSLGIITYRYWWHSSVPTFFRKKLDKLYEIGILWRY